MTLAHSIDVAQIERLQSLRTEFFKLSSLRDVHLFSQSLATDSPVDLAFAFLLEPWIRLWKVAPDAPFSPLRVVTEDLSAGMLDERPNIFMGTNYWAAKPYLSLEHHLNKVTIYAKHLQRMREIFRRNKLVLSIVPEKDYVIDNHFLKTGRFQFVDEAMSHLARLCSDMEIPTLFNEYLTPLSAYETEADFSYFDTHLPGKHYIQIFSQFLGQVGYRWEDISGALRCATIQTGGIFKRDLVTLPRNLRYPWCQPFKQNGSRSLPARPHSATLLARHGSQSPMKRLYCGERFLFSAIHTPRYWPRSG